MLNINLLYRTLFIVSFWLLLALPVMSISSVEEYIELNESTTCTFECNYSSLISEKFIDDNINQIISYHLRALRRAKHKNKERAFIRNYHILNLDILRIRNNIVDLDKTIPHLIEISKNTKYEAEVISQIAFLYSQLSLYSKAAEYASEGIKIMDDKERSLINRLETRHYLTYLLSYIYSLDAGSIELKEALNKKWLKGTLKLMNTDIISKSDYEILNVSLNYILTDVYGTNNFENIIRVFDKRKANEKTIKLNQVMWAKHRLKKGGDSLDMNVLINFLEESKLSKGTRLQYFYIYNICVTILSSDAKLLTPSLFHRVKDTVDKNQKWLKFTEKIHLFELIVDYLKKTDLEEYKIYTKKLIKFYESEFFLRNNLEVSFTDYQINKLNKNDESLRVLNNWNSVLFITSVIFIILIVLFFVYIKYKEKTKKILALLNDDLTEKNNYIAEKNSVLKNFAYTLAHDFQEPLRNLKFALNYDLTNSMDVEEKKDFQKLNYASIEYLNNLISDFLHFTKTNALELGNQVVSLSDCINLAVYNTKNLRGNIVYNISSSKESIIGSKQDWISIFQNLFKNSIKYCPADRSPVITVSFKHTKKYLLILVNDNGSGIPPSKIEYIFKPFSRINPKGTIKGSGLGLSIVVNILKKYGASISVRNLEQGGASFEISIPIN